jgi:hypothetical protein
VQADSSLRHTFANHKILAEVFFMVLLILISIALLAAVSLFGKVRYIYAVALVFGLIMFLATLLGWFTP